MPGAVDVTGIANAAATVTVNGQSTYRKVEYYRDELSLNNGSAPQWQSVTNKAVQGSTTNTVMLKHRGHISTIDNGTRISSDDQKVLVPVIQRSFRVAAESIDLAHPPHLELDPSSFFEPFELFVKKSGVTSQQLTMGLEFQAMTKKVLVPVIQWSFRVAAESIDPAHPRTRN